MCQEGIPWTPLHLAAWNGHSRVAALLSGAAHRLSDEERRVPRWRPGSLPAAAAATPLHLAALRGHSEAVLLFSSFLKICSLSVKFSNFPFNLI